MRFLSSAVWASSALCSIVRSVDGTPIRPGSPAANWHKVNQPLPKQSPLTAHDSIVVADIQYKINPGVADLVTRISQLALKQLEQRPLDSPLHVQNTVDARDSEAVGLHRDMLHWRFSGSEGSLSCTKEEPCAGYREGGSWTVCSSASQMKVFVKDSDLKKAPALPHASHYLGVVAGDRFTPYPKAEPPLNEHSTIVVRDEASKINEEVAEFVKKVSKLALIRFEYPRTQQGKTNDQNRLNLQAMKVLNEIDAQALGLHVSQWRFSGPVGSLSCTKEEPCIGYGEGDSWIVISSAFQTKVTIEGSDPGLRTAQKRPKKKQRQLWQYEDQYQRLHDQLHH
ncbi:hypothetical protein C8R42DRAFT_717051 [Lentinula raphanica]|nr:hypothetical protein C8R42DRAFT_717051 [Lentinula raphanica]